MNKIFHGMTLTVLCLVALQGAAEPMSLMERLHEDRSSYGRYWGDGEWRLKSRLWLPAEADKSTVGLFPLNFLDEAKEVEGLFKSALDVTDKSGDELMGESASAKEKESGLELKDAGTAGIKRSAYGLGGCTIVSNGVFYMAATNLQVSPASGLAVSVAAGSAWINGYRYENTDDLNMPLTTANGSNPRIDRIVVRLSQISRSIQIAIIAGTPAATPSAPELTRTSDVYELGIADVLVPAAATSIVANNITDTRLNTDLCGLVNSLVSAVYE